MKPLTIDELKALKVDDWVWLKVCDTKSYWNISENTNEYLLVYQECYCFGTLNYSDYGKTWLAWKNKEQADAQGEIVELPNPIMRGDSTLGYAIDYYVTKTEYFKDKEEAERRLAELKGEGEC